METLTVKEKETQIHEAAKDYASSKVEWVTREWDLIRAAFEAGAKYQKELSQTNK